MRKTFFALMLAALSMFGILTLSAVPVFPASAADDLPRLVDMADLLSDNEEAELSSLLDEISNRQQVDVVVVTATSMDGASAVVYADDFYDYNGYGYGDERDGILLLISMDERDWYISTHGFAITAITDVGREYISEMFVNDLSMGDYAVSFTNFARLCDNFITQAKSGEPYDVDNLPKEPFEPILSLATAFAIAFIIALISTGIMKGQLKTVHSQTAAEGYMKQDSMKLTRKSDLFLYQKVDRSKKAESSSPDSPNRSGGSQTHTSSSGATHGGGGGKF